LNTYKQRHTWQLKMIVEKKKKKMVLVYMYTASRQWPCLRAVISHQQCFKQLKIGFQSAHNQEKRKVSKSTYYFTRHSCLQPCRQNNLFAADGRLNNSPNAQSLKKKKKKIYQESDIRCVAYVEELLYRRFLLKRK
jgi:hypothetical protein